MASCCWSREKLVYYAWDIRRTVQQHRRGGANSKLSWQWLQVLYAAVHEELRVVVGRTLQTSNANYLGNHSKRRNRERCIGGDNGEVSTTRSTVLPATADEEIAEWFFLEKATNTAYKELFNNEVIIFVRVCARFAEYFHSSPSTLLLAFCYWCVSRRRRARPWTWALAKDISPRREPCLPAGCWRQRRPRFLTSWLLKAARIILHPRTN